MSAIVFKKVAKNFEENPALFETDFQIKEREFTVFVGPSGCGKTTILRLIAGLENVTSGNIFIHNKNVTWEAPKNRNVAMVFQSYALYPHMSVYENLRYPLDILKLPAQKKKEIINHTAQKLEITALLDRKPSQLSGGQKQRVAIGRAVVRKPEIFLLDEPLSNLDARLRETMRSYIRSIHEQLGKTTVYVTHDQQEDILKLPAQKKKEIIKHTAQKLEITALLDRKPSQLSGGQKQRVAIGRAVVRKPEIFLLDEPLSILSASVIASC